MLKKLRQQLADARAKANALNATADRENRVLSAEEQTEFDALIAQCKDLQAKIASQACAMWSGSSDGAFHKAITASPTNLSTVPWLFMIASEKTAR